MSEQGNAKFLFKLEKFMEQMMIVLSRIFFVQFSRPDCTKIKFADSMVTD